MKYLSIDIETGGLDPEKHDLLELGIVAETGDPDTAVEDLPSLRVLFPQSPEAYRLSGWALDNHAGLIHELRTVEGGFPKEGEAHVWLPLFLPPRGKPKHFSTWQRFREGAPWLDGSQKHNLAGKNLASFDLPFIEAALGFPFDRLVPHHRRILDPAILYSRPEDETLPTLAECRRRGEESGLLVPLTEEQKAAHTSLGDCREVIRLLRAKNI